MPPTPRRALPALLALLAAAPFAAAADPKAPLKPGVRVAVVGDSITEQRLYSKYIADYLYACVPDLHAHVVQFGWSGETAAGFAARVDNDLLPFKPDVVTLCYGMNDGGYRAYAPDIGQRYERPLAEIVKKLKAAGATVVVGSPGVVDQHFFNRNRPGQTTPAVYNDNLGHLRDIAKTVAETNGMPFANVHDAMAAAMKQGQAKLGDRYPVGGADGVHPAPNGQLVMAYAFLKAMDLDGDLGTITIDPKGQSTAENGHTIISARDGRVEVESRRYPFCFTGGETDANGTRSILPFVPFNRELNRLTLVVKNAPADKVKVTWGAESKVFTRDELGKGVNLAAVFVKHPLAEAFARIDAKVADQQSFQTVMIKNEITNHRSLRGAAKEDPALADALAAVRERLWATEAKKDAAVKAAVTPVKHAITVEAAE